MPTLLWFRRDLRCHDHPALLEAARHDGQVLACYVLDPRLEASAGPRRLQYLYRALGALSGHLDGKLLVTRGRPERRIPDLARAVGAAAVHVTEDFTPFGRRRDEAVRAALGTVALHATGSPYLVSPGRITKSDGSPYRVFTPFFRAWRGHGWRRPADSGPDSARWIDPAGLFGCVEIPSAGDDLPFGAGEQAARSQWSQFVADGLADYPAGRNRPDLDATSGMSAHLKFGTIHPRTMAVQLGSGDDAYLRELAFRDFYAAVLYHWPESAWQNWNRDFDAIEVDDDVSAREVFEAWKTGRTGFPIVDAGMRQLATTGFMHNRLRMIVASFLVKDLHLPWQWGARWFLDQLVDGDLASNQHGWQWAAGCGTDAAPYFRVFNPTVQGEKFDPDGEYVRRWIPELATTANVHKLARDRPADYPEPIVDHAEERLEALRRYRSLN
ncbi:deoxyribodipyrimidine photolyase [Mycobacterium sp. GA-1841]|uniref:cryptochrome/photolyase family protein n=1 Tax=Mycobacterium sp. GA-1841 TaxID=1834154 RepID=UPI00096CB61B|nr:deoxyribodipyrimidine photo-lyase [Mycobacterium sp. GA-1841]OMC35985.1 deoxyribodipyrimidine photolyase [Mycobacterium sp. GA-1841]